MIGIAVASRELAVLRNDEEVVLPYNQLGLQELLKISDGSEQIILAGNRQWALALAYGLKANGRERINYLPSPKTERGKRFSHVSFLKNALARGVAGRPFFREPAPAPPTPHPWSEIANNYSLLNDDTRRCKHRILDCLRILFPELVTLDLALWRKGSLEALHAGRWDYFSEDDLDYNSSLGRYVPPERQKEARERLKEQLDLLSQLENKQKELREEIELQVGSHPIAQFFGSNLSSQLLALLIGWRDWGKTKPGFRALRSYAGLAVSRVDSKGKLRISRQRPEIRTVLFFLLRTKKGKEIIEQARERLGRERLSRPKQMEILLKEVWKVLG